MSGNGLEIAGTTTIRVRSPTVVLGKAGSVVGALCAAAPIAIFRGSSARPSATGPNRQAGTTAAGSAWLEHCHEFPLCSCVSITLPALHWTTWEHETFTYT